MEKLVLVERFSEDSGIFLINVWCLITMCLHNSQSLTCCSQSCTWKGFQNYWFLSCSGDPVQHQARTTKWSRGRPRFKTPQIHTASRWGRTPPTSLWTRRTCRTPTWRTCLCLANCTSTPSSTTRRSPSSSSPTSNMRTVPGQRQKGFQVQAAGHILVGFW